ncbi:Annexin A7 [Acipenser ruthenus]|uniref:Annexin n=1 Tax=Acipenser ruthenus TaxID=7906 RepID=A0A662YX26_ACIRT|nr:Annexin A7 [Acipenser ruthenus]
MQSQPQGSADPSLPGAGQYPYPGGAPGGYPPMGGGAYPQAPAGGYPGAGGYPAPQGAGGFPAPGGYPQAPAAGGYPSYPGAPAGPGYGVPPGGPGYGGYPQQAPQGYGGGQMPQPGTDEQAIIDVVSRRTNGERQKIKAMFKTLYGKDVIKELKSELSGNMEEVILALFMPTTYYDAWSLRHAMKGAGTQEDVLIEILCSRDNQQIRDIVQCYNTEFQRDLEKDIRTDTSGHFERLLISMCQGNRDENQTVNLQKAQEDAQRLYQAGEGKLGTDESSFNMVLAVRSFPQLKATAEAYATISKRQLESAIDKEFTGSVESGLKAIVKCAQNRPAYFAERLFKAMKGAGTDDSTLTRIIVTRSEIDLVQIKQAFMQMYQKSLHTAVQGETSGDYKNLLLAIVGQ